MCERLRKEDPMNTEYVPSADHPFMMEGQGTIGLEMLEQVCYKTNSHVYFAGLPV